MIAAAIGWIGTIGTMGAYLMLSRGHWRATSIRYAAFNGVGGLLCGAAAAGYGAWPSVASNLVWSLVALHSLVTTLVQRRSLTLAPVVPLRPLDPEPALARAA
jgi:hypothetical protein